MPPNSPTTNLPSAALSVPLASTSPSLFTLKLPFAALMPPNSPTKNLPSAALRVPLTSALPPTVASPVVVKVAALTAPSLEIDATTLLVLSSTCKPRLLLTLTAPSRYVLS